MRCGKWDTTRWHRVREVPQTKGAAVLALCFLRLGQNASSLGQACGQREASEECRCGLLGEIKARCYIAARRSACGQDPRLSSSRGLRGRGRLGQADGERQRALVTFQETGSARASGAAWSTGAGRTGRAALGPYGDRYGCPCRLLPESKPYTPAWLIGPVIFRSAASGRDPRFLNVARSDWGSGARSRDCS